MPPIRSSGSIPHSPAGSSLPQLSAPASPSVDPLEEVRRRIHPSDRAPHPTDLRVHPDAFDLVPPDQKAPHGIPELHVVLAWTARHPEWDGGRFEDIRVAAADFLRALPRALRRHLHTTAHKYEATTCEAESVASYEVRDGVRFWVDLLCPEDPMLRAMADHFPRPANPDLPLRVVDALTKPRNRKSTLFLEAGQLNAEEWDAIFLLARRQGRRVMTLGDLVVIGTGKSFDLCADALTPIRNRDPALRETFRRVAHHLARRLTPIDFRFSEGAVAFYSPVDDRMAWSMPSRARLNVFVHEATHARFARFKNAVRSWCDGRGYAIPFEIDGPSQSLYSRWGSTMTLLNELNSWRAGNSFDGEVDDRAILEVLQAYYRRANPRAMAEFARVWTPERVAGKSVPRLIREAVRDFNRVSTRALIALGWRSLRSQSQIEQMNFLRLAENRFAETEAPKDVASIAWRLTQTSDHDDVKFDAKNLLDSLFPAGVEPQPEGIWELARGAAGWLESVAGDVTVPPALVLAHTALHFAAENGLSDADRALAAMAARYGNAIEDDEKIRSAFAAITSQPGATVDDKARAYAAAWRSRRFGSVWDSWVGEPSLAEAQLLAARHLGRIGPKEAKAIVSQVVARATGDLARRAASSLLTALLEDHGEQRPARLAAIDAVLAAELLDGQPAEHRVDLVNLLLLHTRPEELPRTAERITHLNATEDGAEHDRILAACFLTPPDERTVVPTTWGDAIVAEVMDQAELNAYAKENVAEYYRTVHSRSLTPGRAGLDPRGEPDAAAVQTVRELVADWPAARRERLARAGADLMRILRDPFLYVRRAARYAIASHPAYLIACESQLLELLEAEPGPARTEALRLVAMTREGALPALEDHLKTAFRATEDEVRIFAAGMRDYTLRRA